MIKNKKKLNIGTPLTAYDKKVKTLLVKLSLYLVIFVILIIFMIGINIYRSTLTDFDNKNILELKNYISMLTSQSSKITGNLALAKKYNERWKDISENKKSNQGIEPNIINTQIYELTRKYNIFRYDFNMSIPQKSDINNDNDKKILDIFYSDCKLTFSTSDDIRAISFFEDLKNNITGYVVVNEYTIKKNNEYTFNDLLKISKGEESGIVSVTIGFKWYVAKRII